MLNPLERRFVTERLHILREVSECIRENAQGIGVVEEAHMSIFIDYHIVVEYGEQGLVIVFTVFDRFKVIERITQKVKEDRNFRLISDLQQFPSDIRQGWYIKLAPAIV